jgi:hypothetical protein
MICTIDKDLFKLWPLLSFMQGIGTLHQVDGRAIDLGRKIMHLLDELGRKYPALVKLLDPPIVIFNLQATNINPAAVVIPTGLAPGNVPRLSLVLVEGVTRSGIDRVFSVVDRTIDDLSSHRAKEWTLSLSCMIIVLLC